jgi:hypothetical protein
MASAEKPWFYEGEVGIDGLFDECGDSDQVVFVDENSAALHESTSTSLVPPEEGRSSPWTDPRRKND